MDTLEPPLSAALLSAEEAKERLCGIVEGFFFRRLRIDMENSCGATSWFKALVRHGADPREALAGVLGVSADDIRLGTLGGP